MRATRFTAVAVTVAAAWLVGCGEADTTLPPSDAVDGVDGVPNANGNAIDTPAPGVETPTQQENTPPAGSPGTP